jgi:two-component system, sensor histidine kinase
VDQTFQLFSKCELCRHLERREKEALFARIRICDFAAGETIFVTGSPADSMMIVLRGTVQAVTSPKALLSGDALRSCWSWRGHRVRGVLVPGEIFGENALLDGRARVADVVAITDCSLAIVDRHDYLAFLEQNPSGWQDIARVLCERLRAFDGINVCTPVDRELRRQYAELTQIVLLHYKNWQLAEASQHKSRFLAVASHDLRQPMHALGLFVAQLRSHMTPAEGSRLVDRIEDAVTGMNELFNALLDITKLDAGALTPTVAEFPVAELLGRIGSTFAAVAEEKGLSLRLASTSAWVRSDPVLLERIVLNLVSNAVRYTTSGGIVVGCRRRGVLLRIHVVDSGPGIPEDQQRKIFGEFYRLADAAKTNQAGLGLGLSIVERLCALLDHPIELKSTPGKGSRFSVDVPVAPAATLPKSEPSHQAIIDVIRGKLVVVVDNDARVLEGMGGLLRNWGCRVVTAATPEAALTEVKRIGREARPDLIIADYHLAVGQSGITAIAKLLEAYGAVPAIGMSGDTAPERLCEARESGHHLLHKPVQPITLRAMMNRLLKCGHE